MTIPLIRDLPWVVVPAAQPALFEDPYAALNASGSSDFMGVTLEASVLVLIPSWLAVIVHAFLASLILIIGGMA